MRYADCEIDEFKIRREFREAEEGRVIDAAMRDLVAGRFETNAVHEAMKLGHHPDYHQIKEALDVAALVARHSN